MNPNFKSAMLAAAQLTAAGNLNAATAAIQQALGGESPATNAMARAAQDRSDRIVDVEARWLEGEGQPLPRAEPAAAASPYVATDWKARMSRVARAAEAALAANGLHPQARPEPAAAGTQPQGDGATRRMLAGSHSAPAGNRDYLLYLPAQGTSPGGRLSLVVMLHGCTQTPADFAAGTAMNEHADRHGLVVLYPAQSKAANHSACWNWFNPHDQRAGGGEPSIIAGMTREVIERYDIAPDRVFVAGLSAGGAMAAILGAAYPDLFSAVAVHSGLKPGAAHDLQSALAAMKRGAAAGGPAAVQPGAGPAGRKPVRTIVFHGRQDRTVHPANGRQVAETALASFASEALSSRQENGRSAGGRSFVRTVHADATGTPMVEQWEVQGAGHAWSGGRSDGSHTDPLGPDSSAAMVSFFMAR